MEQSPRFTRGQFLTVVGFGLLAVVLAKVATVENTLTAINSPKLALKSDGYGSSAYGGSH